MSKAQVQEKARELLGSVLDANKAQRAIDMVDRLDQISDIRELITLLQP